MNSLTSYGAFRGGLLCLFPLVVACGSTGSPTALDGGADSRPGTDAAKDSGEKHDAGRDARTQDAAPACRADSGADAAPATFMAPAVSCAYTCPISPDCAETTTPYQCQNLGAWSCIPHAVTCGDWDGGYPPVVSGQCTSSLPTGAALNYAGTSPDGGTRTLPDGRHMQPAGSAWIFDEAGLQGGLTTGMIAIPGTTYVLTVDDGVANHVVRLIDTSKIGSGSSPVVSYVPFNNPATLNSGIAFRAPDLVLVATNDPSPLGTDGGTGTGTVQALTFDQAAGTLALDAARSLGLPMPAASVGGSTVWYVSGVAISPDGTRAVVTGVTDPNLLVFDVAAASPTFGTMLGEVNLGQAETFQVSFDPLDSTTAYVSMWSGAEVLAVDITNPSAPTIKATYATAKDPEGVAFLDARWMVVADDLGDSLSLVDRVAGSVTQVPIETPQPYPGLEPSGAAFDATRSLLYVPLAGENAVSAYSVDLTATPPTILLAGQLPTSWWPSAVLTMPDGSVVVSSMQGNGSGPDDTYFDIGNSYIDVLMRGGIQYVPTPSMSDLSAGAANVAVWNNVEALPGYPTVSCPSGVNDFPLPATNTQGASSAITHVFFIIRENKSFDGLFGDFPNVAGDAAYTLKTLPGEMDVIWHNFRDLGRTFAMADNFYNDSVLSLQGHTWTTYGRSNDYCERTWPVSGDGRNARLIPGSGVANVGKPVEGSLFDWLGNNGIEYDILGEELGLPQNPSTTHPPVDPNYPGGPFITLGHSDDEKACHMIGRARVTCDFGQLVYATLPNDHTQGILANLPAPETYCAVNDEATGMLVDGISHSPLWASSLIIITEDDPSQGGEHIDSHRSPIVLVSPWVKRGYMSQTHFDMSSLHRMFAHIFGKPYPNTRVANAGLPFDMFSATPDYTPYTYSPRTFPLYCGEATTQSEARMTRSWDFDEPDEQPGLGRQVMRWMRGRQLETLTPNQEQEIEARWERRLKKPARAMQPLVHAPPWLRLDADEPE